MLQSLNTIVFDLDGTLYQDLSIHRIYIRYLLRETDRQPWETQLISFVEEVLRGKKLEMNAFYGTDAICESRPETFLLRLGERAAHSCSYESALGANNLLYLGDLWSIVSLLGEALGLPQSGWRHRVYSATRAEMALRGYTGSETLRKALKALSLRYETILLSNSPEEIAAGVLRQLGYEDVFRHIVYDANKPGGMAEALARVCPQALASPETLLSIGDHAFNDLMPVKALGGKTVWIYPYPGVKEPAYDWKLASTEDLAGFIGGFCA